MKFNLTLEMEVDNQELLELVNDYQAFDTYGEADEYINVEDIPEKIIFITLQESNYIEDELRDYLSSDDVTKIEIIKE